LVLLGQSARLEVFLVLCISFGGGEESNVEEHVGLFVVLERFRYYRLLCVEQIFNSSAFFSLLYFLALVG
jgi:hypothetical protein